MRKDANEPDTLMVEAMRDIARVAAELGLPVLVIGATARMLLLERVHGLEPGRRTLDVDYAVAVGSWKDDERLREWLVDTGHFVPDPRRSQRMQFRDAITVDIIPFGGVENENAEIAWPGDDGVRLNVLGLSDLLSSAIPVEIADDLHVPVISPEGLLASKLVAWRERRNEAPGRDIADIAYILRYAESIVGVESLYEEYMDAVVASDYRADVAAARVLGARLAIPLRSSVREQIQHLLMNQLDEDSDLVRDALRYGAFNDALRVVRLLEGVLQGLSFSRAHGDRGE